MCVFILFFFILMRWVSYGEFMTRRVVLCKRLLLVVMSTRSRSSAVGWRM